MITSAQWHKILTSCGVRFDTAASWAPIFERFVQVESFNLGEKEIDDFVGQVLHETSRLEKLKESLSYSAKRMTEVWPHRFPTLESAKPYAYNPEALANKTYGGRLGNNTSGDGYRYFGRGIPMITGKANYQLLEDLTGLPLVDEPQLLEEPRGAMQCALLWWEKRVPDEAFESIERVTRAVNGAEIGLEDRISLTVQARNAFIGAGVIAA